VEPDPSAPDRLVSAEEVDGAEASATMNAVARMKVTTRSLARTNISPPFAESRGPIIGVIAVVLSLGFVSQYLPGMPSGLGVPEWIIIGIWTVVGVIFATRMEVPQYNPEL
jgi:APA family basic amino acid/polyamine antiporter